MLKISLVNHDGIATEPGFCVFFYSAALYHHLWGVGSKFDVTTEEEDDGDSPKMPESANTQRKSIL